MKKEKDTYEFRMEHLGAKCSCTCPCNQTNPIDVTVVFSAGREKQMVTLNKSHVKKLS